MDDVLGTEAHARRLTAASQELSDLAGLVRLGRLAYRMRDYDELVATLHERRAGLMIRQYAVAEQIGRTGVVAVPVREGQDPAVRDDAVRVGARTRPGRGARATRQSGRTRR